MCRKLLFLLSVPALCIIMAFAPAKSPRLLVFSLTKAYHHASIAAGNRAVVQLGREYGFTADTTTDAGVFNDKSLNQYAAVLFLNTTGDVLNDEQQDAFIRFIRNGGGFAGVHAATDTEFDWPWFGQLAGAYFTNHPKQQEAIVQVADPGDASTKHLPLQWKKKDEWYNFRDIQPGLQILLTVDESSYTGGQNGALHPISWKRKFDGGRSFYTALGHTEESYTDPLFLRHLAMGIVYALGKGGE